MMNIEHFSLTRCLYLHLVSVAIYFFCLREAKQKKNAIQLRNVFFPCMLSLALQIYRNKICNRQRFKY